MVIIKMNRGSDLNRTKRAESVKKLTLEKLKEAPLLKQVSSPRGQILIKLLVDEIIKYLIEIIEALMQEENSANYLNCIAMSEKMHKQLERKMANMVGEKCYEIRCEFLEKIEDIEKARASKASKLPFRSELKNQRKNITQNILAYHRANSFNSFGHHHSHQLQNYPSENELPLVSQNDEKANEVASIQLNSIQSKISAMQENHNQKLKESLEKLQRKFEENCRDIKLMAQKHVQFKLSLEEKLELSLQSLWNVTSDNQSKICEIQLQIEQIFER